MKKTLSLILTAMLVAAAAAGCGSNNTDSSSEQASNSTPSSTAEASNTGENTDSIVTEAGTFPLVEEKVELSLLASDHNYIGVLAENDFYKWYEEKTNVHINFTEVEPAAMAEKVNLMLVSGEYPDMMMNAGITPSTEMLYGSQGIFLPLNDLIEEYGIETKRVMDLYSQYLPSAITTPDGNIYALPNISDCYHCTYTTKLWINQTWLDTLKLDVPTTTDEFKEVLTAFKTQDPNGNGVADEVPLTGLKDYGTSNPLCYLLNAFQYTPMSETMLYVDNGTIKCAATQENFKKGLMYVRELVSEGLLDPITFTQSADQLKQFVTDASAVMAGAFGAMSPVDVSGSYDSTPDHRTANYVAIAPLTGPDGYQSTPITGQPYYRGFFVITDKCQYPEVAFRWADYLYSEEATLNSQIGLEGRGRRVCEEGEKGIHGGQALYEKLSHEDESQIPNLSAQNVTMAAQTSDFRLSRYVDYSDPNYAITNNEVRLYEATKLYEPAAHPENHLTESYLSDADSAEVAQISASISTYIAEQMAAFCLGTKDLEKDWDSYLKEFENMNLPRLLEIQQAAYDRQHQ